MQRGEYPRCSQGPKGSNHSGNSESEYSRLHNKFILFDIAPEGFPRQGSAHRHRLSLSYGRSSI